MSVEGAPRSVISRLPVDRIVELEPGRRVRVECLVPETLWVFATHFPRFPVVPGVFILGTAAELARTLLLGEDQPGWRMVGAQRLKFRHYVRPGDRLDLDVTVTERSGDEAIAVGSASVGDVLVTSMGSLRFVRDAG